MPDLATELTHLDQADAHIAQAKRNIARVLERLATSSQPGIEVGDSATVLETMNSTLAAFQEHRALIVQTIQDIRDGKFA
jgi:hypothetical protein